MGLPPGEDRSSRKALMRAFSPASGADHPAWMHIALDGRTVHNSHYLAASFLYQMQTLLGTEAASPKVMKSNMIRRQGKELYIDLDQVPARTAAILRTGRRARTACR